MCLRLCTGHQQNMIDQMNDTTGAKQGSIIPLWHFTFWSSHLGEELSYREHLPDDDIRQITPSFMPRWLFFSPWQSSIFPPLRINNPLLCSGIILRSIVMTLGFILVWIVVSLRRSAALDWSTIIYATCISLLIVFSHFTGDFSGHWRGKNPLWPATYFL